MRSIFYRVVEMPEKGIAKLPKDEIPYMPMLDINNDENLHSAARIAASHFYFKHFLERKFFDDGFSLTFMLYENKDGPAICHVSVELCRTLKFLSSKLSRLRPEGDAV